MSLHIVVNSGNKDVVKILIDKGLDINATDKYGRIPFMYMAQKGRTNTAMLFIEMGVNTFALKGRHSNTIIIA